MASKQIVLILEMLIFLIKKILKEIVKENEKYFRNFLDFYIKK
jgi:hypothetical protein